MFSPRVESQEDTPLFRLSITQAPSSLNPQLQKSNSGNYLIQNLFRGLLRVNKDSHLVSDLASKCYRKTVKHQKKVICHLRPQLKWSDGSPIIAPDFIKSFLKLLDPQTKAPRPDLLFSILNAQDIYQKKKPPSELGIMARGTNQIEFILKDDAKEFEWNLAHLALSPIKNEITSDPNLATKILTSGPFSIEKYDSGKGFLLKPNKFYWDHNSRRPRIEVQIIPEETMALALYEKKELDLIRRIPTLFIEKYRQNKEFLWIPVDRFDYIGFGPTLRRRKDLRKALALSLNYIELQKLFHSDNPPPGCPGLNNSLFFDGKKNLPCHLFDLGEAQSAYKKDLEFNKLLPKIEFELQYSSLGGEDQRRAMEWMQDQWKKNLGLSVLVRVRDNKTYIDGLKESPPTMFRKGLSPDRPTCSAFLEVFTKNHIDNHIQLNDNEFEKIFNQLSSASDPLFQKKLCYAGIQYLIDQYYIIPLGNIHWAMMLAQPWSGFELNGLNHLNLGSITYGQKRESTKADKFF